MRTTTEIFGTVASETALIIFAPWRMIPWRSTAVPIMKPGTSARKSSGTLKALQVWMKRAALSAESTKSTPPVYFGLVGDDADDAAVEPPVADDQLLRPALVDRQEAVGVEQRVEHLRMSKGRFSSAGTISAIGVWEAGAAGGAAAAPPASCPA